MIGEIHADLASYMVRAYLLAGLIFHKAVWELLKRKGPPPAAGNPSALGSVTLVKLAKIGILAGIIVQCLLPFDLLPMVPSGSPESLWAGLLLYSAGLLIAVTARIQLGRNWSDIEVAHLKRDHAVVSNGVYRYIRHPIYTGDLLLLCGLELALNSWLVLGVAALALAVSQKAAREEKDLVGGLPAYAAYCRQTKRFIPFVF
jgi:protein-S-isoprenylcysteine O-methyltransferase Ste14